MSLVEGTEWFQFTHPGGVRLVSEFVLPNTYHVSIHAPGRGATVKKLDKKLSEDVSIHAPGRGATYLYHYKTRFSIGFNSRTREGCDGVYATSAW